MERGKSSDLSGDRLDAAEGSRLCEPIRGGGGRRATGLRATMSPDLGLLPDYGTKQYDQALDVQHGGQHGAPSLALHQRVPVQPVRVGGVMVLCRGAGLRWGVL